MAVDKSAIAAAAAAKYKEKSLEARNASTVDEALAKQEEGFKEAMEVLLTMFLAQAKVNGGVCSNGGPIANANIE